jgi:hypothetical protein
LIASQASNNQPIACTAGNKSPLRAINLRMNDLRRMGRFIPLSLLAVQAGLSFALAFWPPAW